MRLIEEAGMQCIRQYMLLNKETIAVAESVTAGLLQWGFSDIPDAARFFNGGITAYNLEQKYKHLRVEPTHALEVNCVSQKVANEMAENACGLFNSRWGIGITGYATPVPESGGELFAYYAIAKNGVSITGAKLMPVAEQAFEVQQYYAGMVMHVFVKQLQ
ncbi:MAG: nicotinamide-nucleotide amidohydrolase family protein [Chitinophagaceae bacterium]|nr:nicotinamide-nucleotide amidohydrolase family protein [Chitinophagaceae bacterium]